MTIRVNTSAVAQIVPPAATALDTGNHLAANTTLATDSHLVHPNLFDRFDATPGTFDPAGNVLPAVSWLDPLTYKVAGNYKLPGDSPAELQAMHTVQDARTPEQSVASLQLSKNGTNGMWLSYAGEYAQKAGPLKGLLLKGLIEAVIGTDGVAVALRKIVAKEDRPFQKDPSITVVGDPPGGKSYPSGHAAAAFAAATVLAHFMPERSAEFYGAAANVARSRVYNGVHYPGDVAEGARFGTGWAKAFLLENIKRGVVSK